MANGTHTAKTNRGFGLPWLPCLIEVFRPIHLEDLILWTDEILRIAMALETPFHLERVNLPKRNTLGTPWIGAYAKLVKERSVEA